MFVRTAIASLMALVSSVPMQAQAMQASGPGWACSSGTVLVDGVYFVSTYCWETGPGGYGGGGVTIPGDGGGGGGGEIGYLVVADVLVRFDGREVDASRNHSCSEELVLRQQTAQRALAVYPLMPRNTTVEVLFSGGASQSFKRVALTGSLQFVPTTGCG
jgi:hypothetical protein